MTVNFAAASWGASQGFDKTRPLGYKVRVLSPFPAMETYADH